MTIFVVYLLLEIKCYSKLQKNLAIQNLPYTCLLIFESFYKFLHSKLLLEDADKVRMEGGIFCVRSRWRNSSPETVVFRGA